MNGIFPDYVGPSVEFRHHSLYPDWVTPGQIEVEITETGGSGSKAKADDLRATAHGRRLLREDDEIMAVIIAAMRVMQ